MSIEFPIIDWIQQAKDIAVIIAAGPVGTVINLLIYVFIVILVLAVVFNVFHGKHDDQRAERQGHSRK